MYASIAQLEEVLALCHKAQQLSDTHGGMPVNVEKARESLRFFICDPHSLVLYNGTAVLIAQAAPSWCRDGYMIVNHLVYADKNGLPLIREYLRWAKGFPGHNDIFLGTSYGGEKGERAETLFSKLGLKRVGAQHKVI
ncbi:hypothetical protein HBA55_29735 [Pseudomaricurvus alkylphenolicus]|uniref:hypothetical protein n=1 Tax=Pseudomaricurvus alkylphenolicus TaxID=1306991 RepID=UPI00141F8390|nr:hypothetical protein [Pseudomaricurvus alkylphenolicus]NIB43821.1 hypothetical protein [Pseudomaricurvus alkylphenolicus]